jgi:hypothetical protein
VSFVSWRFAPDRILSLCCVRTLGATGSSLQCRLDELAQAEETVLHEGWVRLPERILIEEGVPVEGEDADNGFGNDALWNSVRTIRSESAPEATL